jgi:hypothetical protein
LESSLLFSLSKIMDFYENWSYAEVSIIFRTNKIYKSNFIYFDLPLKYLQSDKRYLRESMIKII